MDTDIGSFIVRNKYILGGRPHIAGTRTSVLTIAIFYKKGYTIEEIYTQLDHLSLEHIYAALSFYYAHKSEIEEDILNEENEYVRHYNEHSYGLPLKAHE